MRDVSMLLCQDWINQHSPTNLLFSRLLAMQQHVAEQLFYDTFDSFFGESENDKEPIWGSVIN